MSIFINQSGISLYQALHPETLPVSITEPELVLESELPARLQTINDDIKDLQDKTTDIIYNEDTEITSIKNISIENIITSSVNKGINIQIINESGNQVNAVTMSPVGNFTFTGDIINPFMHTDWLRTKFLCSTSHADNLVIGRVYDRGDTQNLITINNVSAVTTFEGNIVTPQIDSSNVKTKFICSTSHTENLVIARIANIDGYTINSITIDNSTGITTFGGNIITPHTNSNIIRTKYICTTSYTENLVIARVASVNDYTVNAITLDNSTGITTFEGNIITPQTNSNIIRTKFICSPSYAENLIIGRVWTNGQTGNLITINNINGITTFTGNIVAPNITSLESNCLKISYNTEELYTYINSKLSVNGDVIITGNNSLIDLFNKLANLTGVIGNVTGFTGDLYAENVASSNGSLNDVIDKTQNIIRIPGTGEEPISYTEIDGVSFQTTLGRISNIEFTLSNISYDPMLPSTDISGNLTVGLLNGNKIGTSSSFIYNNYSPYIPVCDSNGVIEVGVSIDFHDLSTEQDNRARISCVGSNILELSGAASMRMTRIDVSAGMALRTGYTVMKFTKSDPAINMLTLDATTDVATFSGNIVAPSLNGNKIGASNEGFGYTTDAPYIPVCKANGITEIGYRLDFHLADATFRDFSAYLSNSALNTLRIYGTTDNSGTLETNVLAIRTNGEDVRLQLSTNQYHNLSMFNKTGTSLWVMDSDGTNGLERWSTVRINSINASTRTTAMTYTAGTPSNTTIAGDLTVTGSIHGTLAGSQTITHKTKYIGIVTPGCFVETTGEIYREPPKIGTISIWNEPTEEGQKGYYTETQNISNLSPYENCISIVKQATLSSNKIIGVCTEIIDHEFCKFATHGDVLIKCISAVYNVGEILIPTVNGYAKKGQQGEILDAMLNMIPRAKITSVETAEIDSESVCAFISI